MRPHILLCSINYWASILMEAEGRDRPQLLPASCGLPRSGIGTPSGPSPFFKVVVEGRGGTWENSFKWRVGCWLCMRKEVLCVIFSWVGKESACSAGDQGSIPELGWSPGKGNGNPVQFSCLGNPMDRGAWQAAVPRVTRVGHDLATKQPNPLFYVYHLSS